MKQPHDERPWWARLILDPLGWLFSALLALLGLLVAPIGRWLDRPRNDKGGTP